MPLFVLATPIGNLGELSARAEGVLDGADLVLCEDTRRTRKLFASRGVESPELWSCNAHSEESRIPAVLERLAREQAIVLVSDAGTPAISDPGGRIVRAAHEAGHRVHAVAGPSSVAAALSVSGLPASPFHFLGFPPRRPGERRRWLEEASRLPGTLVILEAGNRVGGLVGVASELLHGRDACLCRELTKSFEEIVLAPLDQLSREPRRGEVVLIIGPGSAVAPPPPPSGTSLTDIARLLAQRWGCSRSEAYARLVDLEE